MFGHLRPLLIAAGMDEDDPNPLRSLFDTLRAKEAARKRGQLCERPYGDQPDTRH